MALPRCWAPRVLASWPISSSITRAGMPASSSQVGRRDPETFPGTDWANKAMWRTTDENQIARDLEELQAERTATIARLDSREQELDAQLLEAKRSANADERQLLTGQGDDLTSVVAECLSDLGFGTKNMDEIYPAGDRREDLQVTTSEVSDWIVLVEVRGYRGGAQLRDLLRIQRFRTRYLRDNHKDVSALWYVVNQFSEQDPGSRVSHSWPWTSCAGRGATANRRRRIGGLSVDKGTADAEPACPARFWQRPAFGKANKLSVTI